MIDQLIQRWIRAVSGALAVCASLVALLLGSSDVAQCYNPYMILFDHGSAQINGAGQVVIDQALSDLDAIGSTQILLVGHADRFGSSVGNMDLSRRRAEAVRRALVMGGVPKSSIEIIAVGEEQPAAPTEDGVREQLDRRVDMIIPWNAVVPALEENE